MHEDCIFKDVLKSLMDERLSLFGHSYLDRFVRWVGLKPDWPRRTVFWMAVTWLPLFILSLFGDQSAVHLTFIRDFPVHIRFLIGIPMLIFGERYVESRLKNVIPIFVERGMITPQNEPLISSILTRVRKLSGAPFSEVLILLASISIVQSHELLDLPMKIVSWKTAGTLTANWANHWYQWVSLIVYHFILFRWAWKFLVWLYFLFRIANSGLVIQSHHPDKRGGLMFVLARHRAFVAILFVVSMVMSANIGRMVMYGGHDLMDFQSMLIAYLIIAVLVYLVPLVVFTPLLLRTKRSGLRTYGRFAARHAIDFEKRWDHTSALGGDSPLGIQEISANTDLDSSYEHLREMQLVLVSRRFLISIACFAAIPFLPLALFKVPLGDILKELAKIMI